MGIKARLFRLSTSDQGTFGVLITPGYTCETIELPRLENKRNISCIPYGEYAVIWNYSNTFKRKMYLITDVEGRSGIRIHPGNFAGDQAKGFKSDSYGCILPGRYKGVLGNQGAVLHSRLALIDLENAMQRRPFTLEINETMLSGEGKAGIAR